MENYTSHYTNEYGEDWTFEYIYSDQKGLVKGIDVDWVEYPVIEGHPLYLYLNSDEAFWLKKSWGSATNSVAGSIVYNSLDTAFIQSKGFVAQIATDAICE